MSDTLKSLPCRLRALSIPVSILCASALLPGCSLLYDLSTSQCSVNADCASVGEGLICGSEHFCQIDNSGCATHIDCLDRQDNIGESACIKDQGKARGECVTLTTEDCPQLLPLGQADVELRSGDPVIFGAFTNVTLTARLYNYDLAAKEFQNKNGGIPTQGGTRPVLILACNGNATEGDPSGGFAASLDRSMDHLIKLHVPGVLSSLEAADLKRVFEEKGRDAKMFFMSSQESDSSLNTLLDSGLVWQVLPGGTSLAKAYKPVVDRTLAFLQSKGSLTGTARIAQVTTPDIHLLADMSAIVQSDPPDGIVFNGMSVLENLRNFNFRGFTTPSTIADGMADLSEQVNSLLEFKPHIIISTGTTEFLTKIVPALEQQWDSRAAGQAHPFYILSPYQYNRSQTTSLLTSFPTVQQRLIGLNAPAATNNTLYSQYLSAFTQAYPSVVNYEGYENFYDSAYYLLYAASAAAPTLTDGSSIVVGMGRLLAGEAHNVGTLDMSYALGALGRSLSITLNGTMGPPNFNVVTGGRDDVGSVWCIDTTKKTQSDVLSYRASDGTMQGTFPCFADY